jgi:YD repeat-containing protein
VNVGTNGGSAYTRSGSVPSASDTVLVNLYGYAGDAVQQLALTGGPTGGTFTLTFNGQTTSPLAYNASAAAVQAALQALSTVGTGNVFVAGGAGGPWTVRFGGSLAGAYQPQLTANGAGLTGGASPSVAVTSSQLGGDAGRVQQVTDPRGLVSKTDYDPLGRTVRTVAAFTNGIPTASSDKTTEFTYDGDSNLLTVQADEPSGAFEQTQYVYNVTTASGSNLNSKDLVCRSVRLAWSGVWLPATDNRTWPRPRLPSPWSRRSAGSPPNNLSICSSTRSAWARPVARCWSSWRTATAGPSPTPGNSSASPPSSASASTSPPRRGARTCRHPRRGSDHGQAVRHLQPPW